LADKCSAPLRLSPSIHHGEHEHTNVYLHITPRRDHAPQPRLNVRLTPNSNLTAGTN